MSPTISFLCVMALMALASYGWGSLLLAVLLRGRAPEGSEDLGVAMQIAIGLAVFLAVGGLAVAAGIGGFVFLLGWQIAGAVLGVHRIVRHWGRAPWRRVLASAVALGAVGFCAFGVALTGPFNANDDGPAYIYLAQRLLSTGGLIDPFNTRRVNSYGGAELFQALVLRTSGNSVGLGIEWFLFTLLLVALVVRTVQRPYAPLVALIVGAGVVLVRPVGIWVNVAPTFSGAALTLALMQLLRGARRAEAEPWRFAVGGVFLAGILSLRFEFIIPAALIVLAVPVVVVRGRPGRSALLAAAGGFVVAFIGWAVALARSSGTALFPLLSGNWTSENQWRDPAVHSLSAYLRRLSLGVREDHWDVAIVGSLLLVLGVLALGRYLGTLEGESARRVNTSAVVLVAGAVGCLIAITSESVELSGALLTDIGRYSAPSTLACVAFALDVALEAATSRGPARATAAAVGSSPSGILRSRLTRGFALLGALGLFLAVLGVPLSFYAPATRDAARDGVGLLTGNRVLVDHFSAERAFYAQLNLAVPRGSYVLAAVDEPVLLAFNRFSFTTLDIVAGSSPAPHLPVFQGGNAVVSYLEHLGIDGIVASSPRRAGFYNLSAAEANVNSGIYNYRIAARAVVAWATDLATIRTEDRDYLTKVGTLEYLPFAPLHKTASPSNG